MVASTQERGRRLHLGEVDGVGIGPAEVVIEASEPGGTKHGLSYRGLSTTPAGDVVGSLR